MSKQLMIRIGIGTTAIISIMCIAFLIYNNSRKVINKQQFESEGIIVGVGDNNNNNNGDKVTAESSSNSNNSSENTTEAPKEVAESTSSIAGNWAAYDGSTVMEFIPARCNEAIVYIPDKDIYYKGTYETDDKTYIKIKYKNVYDESITGVMDLTVVEIETSLFGDIILVVKEEDGTEYTMRPAS